MLCVAANSPTFAVVCPSFLRTLTGYWGNFANFAAQLRIRSLSRRKGGAAQATNKGAWYTSIFVPAWCPCSLFAGSQLPFRRKLRVCTIIHHFVIHATSAHNYHRGTIKYDTREQTMNHTPSHTKIIPPSTHDIVPKQSPSPSTLGVFLRLVRWRQSTYASTCCGSITAPQSTTSRCWLDVGG